MREVRLITDYRYDHQVWNEGSLEGDFLASLIEVYTRVVTYVSIKAPPPNSI